MRKMLLAGLFTASVIACASILYGGDFRTYPTGGVTVSHAASSEGLYFDTPARSVAYNVQIVKVTTGGTLRFATIYHSEPRNKVDGKPGDSIRLGYSDGPFTYAMPGNCQYRLWGVQDDSQSLLFSPDEFGLPGWGGTGNPMMVKGLPGDKYYYIFFLAVGDDNNDKNVEDSDYRHILLQARTKDFVHVDLRTEVDGVTCWKPFSDSVSKLWRRAKPLIDVQGKRVCNRIGRKQGYTQGLIGSICMQDNTYHFFCTEIDSDNKTYLFHRMCRNIATLENTWSPATRVSNEALMEGTVIRVAKAPRMNKWVVLYNGYTDRQRNNQLRQGLMLQVTYDMTVIGKGGLSSLKFFPRSFSGLGINDEHDLGLARGNGVFAQHDFMTDEYGNLAAPCDDGAAGSRGLLTWTAMTAAVYGSKVYWAEFDLRENVGGQ
ncbi:MAG: hypothetical protein ACLQNE_29105 [Thermoguttaceae bacterium]